MLPERDSSPGASAIEPAPPRPGRHVLVIDDDAQVRNLLCEYLEMLGFRVQPASGGVEGLALFVEQSYDLVITDLMMPDMTGWDVSRAIRARGATVPVILVTGSVDNLEARHVREAGLTVVPKPFTLQDLRAAIAAVVPAAAAEAPRAAGVTDAPGTDAAAGDGTDLVQALRATLDAARSIVASLDMALRAAEGLAHEHGQAVAARAQLLQAHDALTRAHEETLRDLAQLRSQHDQVAQDRRRATEELTAILRRLRP
jgi:DNA-binding response OmpR family regulator